MQKHVKKLSFVLSMILILQGFILSPVIWTVRADGSGIPAEVGREKVSPNPATYPEFYQTGNPGSDGKMMTEQDSMTEFAGEKQSVAEKELIPAAGSVEKVLVIPIQFSDVQFSPSHNNTYYSNILDQMKNYYESNSRYVPNSRGMSITYTIAPVVTTTAAMRFFGEDDKLGDDNKNGPIYNLAREAVRLSDAGVDFSQFDRNNDGIVDHLFIIHAGNGQEDSAVSSDIWSHRWSIQSGEQADGKVAAGYTCVPETGTLGVFAHEFGHDIGLPDLYDTNSLTNGYSMGVGNWDIMGSGSWNYLQGNAPGTCPANLSAWCKELLGWNTVTNVTGNGDLTLTNINGNNDQAYRIWTNGNSGGNEYFLAEFRKKAGFDQALPGEGLLVWHIDKQWITATMAGNVVNSASSRLGVELEQADGRQDLYHYDRMNQGDLGDPFPGDTYNRDFCAAPYSFSYSNIPNGLNPPVNSFVELTDITFPVGSGQNWSVSFHANITPHAPDTALLLGSPSDNSVVSIQPTFSWRMVPSAQKYILQVSGTADFSSEVTEYNLAAIGGGVYYNSRRYEYTLPGTLTAGKTYYWRVKGMNDLSNAGNSVYSDVRKIFVVNPSIGNWIEKSPVIKEITGPAITSVNEMIYAVDGEQTTVYSYNLGTNVWQVKNSSGMTAARTSVGVASIGGAIYVIGGMINNTAVNTVEAYNPSTNTWSAMPSLNKGRTGFSVLTVNNKIYVFGGIGSDGAVLSGGEVYENGAWTELSNNMLDNIQKARYNAGAVELDGKIYIIGGCTEDASLARNMLVYDIGTGDWSTAAGLPTARKNLRVEILGRKIYALGGETSGNGNVGKTCNTVEVFDPDNGEWSSVAGMLVERSSFGSTVMSDRIYIVGGAVTEGSGLTTCLRSMEVFDQGMVFITAAPSGLSFSFDGPDAGKLKGIDATMEYSLDGGIHFTAVAPGNESIIPTPSAISAANDIYCRVATDVDDPAHKPAGNVAVIDIQPGSAVTTVVGNDTSNTLTGLNNTMEISTNQQDWTEFDTLPDLTRNVTIYVRYKRTGVKMPGPAQTFQFTIPVVPTPVPDPGPVFFPGGGLPPVLPPADNPKTEDTVFDETALGAQLNNAGSPLVTAVIPADAANQNVQFEPGLLGSLVSKGKALVIDGTDVDMTLSASFIRSTLQTQMEERARAKIGVERISGTNAASLLKDAAKDDGVGLYNVAGALYEFTAEVVTADKTKVITAFNEPLVIRIRLNAASLKGIDTDKLGVYYYNPIKGTWEYAGGKYDAAKGVMEFSAAHFSVYAVMKNDVTFKDISKHWARKDIERMASKNIAIGDGSGNFYPNVTIKRSEFVSLLVRAMGLSGNPGKTVQYKDVGNGKWYASDLNLAFGAGIITEADGVLFRPDADITRGEMAVMISRALASRLKAAAPDQEEIDRQLAAFADEKTLAGEVRTAVAVTAGRKIILGRPGGVFAPEVNATKAEAIVIIGRLLKNL